MPEAQPLYDVEAERLLLGAMMYHRDALAAGSVCESSDFWHPGHRNIFEVIVALDEAGASAVEPAIVRDELRRRGLLAASAGEDIELTRMVTDGKHQNARRYVAIIREAAARRALVNASAEISELAHNIEAGDALVRAKELVDRLASGASAKVLRPFTRVLLDLSAPLSTPVIVQRLLYAGYLTVLQSEPGVGKTWIATWLVKAVLEEGRDVVYMDEEGGAELVTERLCALGTDPRLVAEHLHYFPFEHREWTLDDLAALRQMVEGIDDPALAVFDSLPDFLAGAHKSEDSSTDVTEFVLTVCAVFRAAGVAQLLLDHLPKPPTDARAKRQSRYSRGSGAKLGKADATLLLETVEEFDVTTSGRLKLWKTKDRRGRLDIPALGKPGLELSVKVSQGSLAIEITEPHGWDGPTEIMAKVEELCRNARGTLLSKTQITKAVGARAETVGDAVDRLVSKGVLETGPGYRGNEAYRIVRGLSVVADEDPREDF